MKLGRLPKEREPPLRIGLRGLARKEAGQGSKEGVLPVQGDQPRRHLIRALGLDPRRERALETGPRLRPGHRARGSPRQAAANEGRGSLRGRGR